MPRTDSELLHTAIDLAVRKLETALDEELVYNAKTIRLDCAFVLDLKDLLERLQMAIHRHA